MLYVWAGSILALIIVAWLLYCVAAIHRLEAKVDRLLQVLEPPDSIAKPVPLSVQDLARAGLKLEAIRQYREETGCSLLEAKQAVDAFLDSRENV